MTSIYVGNLSYDTTEKELRQLFAKYGAVGQVKISKGSGFVEMPDAAAAERAMRELDGKPFQGRTLKVNEARPRDDGGARRREGRAEGARPPRREGTGRSQDNRGGDASDISFPRHIVPAGTAEAVKRGFPIEHFGLRVNTFAVWGREGREKEKFLLKETIGALSQEITTKGYAAKQLETIRAITQREIRYFSAGTSSRLIVGIGGESVYETGITLHHTYGIPYIPGQAVKGATRSLYLLEKHDGDEKKALKEDKLFVQLFGDQTQQGQVIFYDAFPTAQELNLELDIMNPHYAPYYQEGKPPADYHEPKPIKFLVVPANTEFLFLIALTDRAEKILLDTATEWVKKTLTDHGVGAKTAVGYGYFEKP